jgi:hypothetical protein
MFYNLIPHDLMALILLDANRYYEALNMFPLLLELTQRAQCCSEGDIRALYQILLIACFWLKQHSVSEIWHVSAISRTKPERKDTLLMELSPS